MAGGDRKREAPCEVQPFPRGNGTPTRAIPRIDWKRTVALSASLLCLVAAAALSAFPFVSDWASAQQADHDFTSQRDTLEQKDDAEVQRVLDDAAQYNVQIAGEGPISETAAYDSQLDLGIGRELCWVEIPRIGIKAPVYRGSDDREIEQALMAGAVHVRGTSLPVGGNSANTVITGHTGMHQTRMFDQLDELEKGDTIILWTAGHPFAYEVTGSELVTPDRADVMDIKPGIDQCTLITCRNPERPEAGLLPSGTYSHRLVVHSSRTEWDGEAPSASYEYLANPRTAQFMGSIAGLGMAAWIIATLIARPRKTWYLDRVLGNRETSSSEIARLNNAIGTMYLEIGTFHRARLVVFGGTAKGRWHRIKGDRSRFVLDFGTSQSGPKRVKAIRGLNDVVLPRGPFEAQALDNELGIDVDYCANLLVFSKAKPSNTRQNRRRT